MMPSFAEIAQLMTAGALVFNCWQTWRNGRHAKDIKSEVADIKKQTNGITEKLLQVTKDAEFAKGVKQGENNSKQ